MVAGISNYNLELDKIIKTVKKERARTVLLQFPDGLKKEACKVAEFLEKATQTTCLIWLASCYGSCDIPVLPPELKRKIDLVVQFGHTSWPYKGKDIKILQI